MPPTLEPVCPGGPGGPGNPGGPYKGGQFSTLNRHRNAIFVLTVVKLEKDLTIKGMLRISCE